MKTALIVATIIAMASPALASSPADLFCNIQDTARNHLSNLVIGWPALCPVRLALRHGPGEG